MYCYAGNVHIHSLYSDGSGSIKQIAAAAAEAGLNFIVVTDHETLQGLPEESYIDAVAVLVGVELNRQHSHYLALGLSRMVEPDHENPQLVIERVRQAGAIGFLAHPFEKGSRYIEKGRAYPWKTWPVFNFDGIEIWNYSSHWRGRHPSLFKTLYYFFFNRNAAMDGPPAGLLELWDCYTGAGHKVSAIGGSDAHAFPYRLGPFTINLFPYLYLFSTINTYILTDRKLSGDYKKAKAQIMSALRDGRSYISFDRLHSGAGFKFFGKTGRGELHIGASSHPDEAVIFNIEAPVSRSVLRLFHNGRLLAEKQGPSLSVEAKVAGAYRVEVYFKPRFGRPRPWIYSNPIYIS